MEILEKTENVNLDISGRYLTKSINLKLLSNERVKKQGSPSPKVAFRKFVAENNYQLQIIEESLLDQFNAGTLQKKNRKKRN